MISPRATVTLVLGGLAAAGLFAALATTGASGGGGGGSEPPEKQAIEQAEASAQAAAEAGPHASKEPQSTGVASCPNVSALNPKTGIFSYDPRYPPPPGWRGPIENIATVVSRTGVAYTIVAGAAEKDAQQGLVRVEAIVTDPCAVMAGLVPAPPSGGDYPTPGRTGPVTLTAVEGDWILFSTANGITGRLNYVTGQFK